MPFYKNLAVLLSTLSFLATLAVRASEVDHAKFSKVVEDPTVQVLTVNTAKESPVILQSPCASATFTPLNQFSIYRNLEFDEQGKLIKGAWKQSVQESGCGQERLLNVLLIIDTDSDDFKNLRGISLYPGTTKADALLQKDATLQAMVAANLSGDDNCKNIYIEDTKFLKLAGPTEEGTKRTHHGTNYGQ